MPNGLQATRNLAAHQREARFVFNSATATRCKPYSQTIRPQKINPSSAADSAELILLGLIEILGVLQFSDQGTWIEIMGFDQIIKGITMIAQLGIEQPDKKVRVHLKKAG